jgi:hypothetical protein
MRPLPRTPLWAALALLAACAPDRALAPEVHEPLFLIGESPTRALIGDTPLITYDATAGVLVTRLDVNQGILNAAQTGRANFVLRVSYTITNDAGQSANPPPDEKSLSDKIALADPRPHPFILIGYETPWGGNDDDGKPMSGDLTVSYIIELVHMSPGRTSIIETRTGSVMVDGSTALVGETPANNLVNVTGIEYVMGQGFEVSMTLNQGLWTAAQTGEAPFGLDLDLTVTNDAGQMAIIDPQPMLVSDIKLDLAPEPGDPVAFGLMVPWNGQDTNGTAMTGAARVRYCVQYLVIDPNTGAVGSAGQIVELVGFFDVMLGEGNLQ